MSVQSQFTQENSGNKKEDITTQSLESSLDSSLKTSPSSRQFLSERTVSAQRNVREICLTSEQFRCYAAEHITEEEAERNYERILREKKSAKVRRWRKKQKLTKQAEESAVAEAKEVHDQLTRERQALVERLCKINSSIVEIQQKRAEAYSQVCRFKKII